MVRRAATALPAAAAKWMAAKAAEIVVAETAAAWVGTAEAAAGGRDGISLRVGACGGSVVGGVSVAVLVESSVSRPAASAAQVVVGAGVAL